MSTITNINEDYSSRLVPDYVEPIVSIIFESETEYQHWYNNIAVKHANWVYKNAYAHAQNQAFVGIDLATPLKVQTTVFLCDHAGKKKKTHTTQDTIKRLRKNPSIKIGCSASIYKHYLTNNRIEVVYNWIHPDHEPCDLEELAMSRLPAAVKAWIDDHVSKCMDWRAIKNLLRLDEKTLLNIQQSSTSSFFPPSLLINYQHVQNVINSRLNKLYKKDANHKESVKLWVQHLKTEKQCNTFFKIHDNGPFLVSWVNNWQRVHLEAAEEWCIDSTHNTCKSFQENNKDAYLFNIVVRSPITNKGLPVCFFITDDDTIPSLKQWLSWLKQTFQLNVKRIMVDCSAIEIAAISGVFEDVDVLLCHWHIKREWETHIKKVVEVIGSVEESNHLKESVRASLNTMMHARTPGIFDLTYRLFCAQFEENCSIFVLYFQNVWLVKKELWCKAWRPSATFHTNNLVETFHSQLKSFYLGRSRSFRVDRLIYLLSEVVAVDFLQDSIKSQYGFKQITLSIAEQNKKKTAEQIDCDIAFSMVEHIEEENLYRCKSFTTEQLYYNIQYYNNYLSHCSCPDPSPLCKHIFLVSNTTLIPFTLRVSLPSAATASNASHASHADHSLDNAQVCQDLKKNIEKYTRLSCEEYEKKKIEWADNPEELSKLESIVKEAYFKAKHVGISQQPRSQSQ